MYCGTCPAWRAPRVAEDAAVAMRAQRAGVDTEKGDCKLQPPSLPKRADEWCMQHPQRRPMMTPSVSPAQLEQEELGL